MKNEEVRDKGANPIEYVLRAVGSTVISLIGIEFLRAAFVLRLARDWSSLSIRGVKGKGTEGPGLSISTEFTFGKVLGKAKEEKYG